MKPIFGTDLTTDKRNEKDNSAVFVAQTPSAAMAGALEGSKARAAETLKKSQLPKGLGILKKWVGFAALLIVLSIFRAFTKNLGELSFETAYENAGWLFWLAGGCILVWLALALWSKRRSQTVLGQEESTQALIHLENTVKAVYNELGVPENARDVDVLKFFYKVKKRETKVWEKAMKIGWCYNFEFKLFADSENIYLASRRNKYAFPLSCIKGIRTVEKRISMIGWNKEESFDRGIYKPYKMVAGGTGRIYCKQYCILELEYQGETYGLYFPAYELSAFQECIK